MLLLDDYPQLALIAWNRKERTVSPEEAFGLYEANPQWIDQNTLEEHERALLQKLIQDHGKGVWNGYSRRAP